jgi:tetratricopeptide (TPR) repeat protein
VRVCALLALVGTAAFLVFRPGTMEPDYDQPVWAVNAPAYARPAPASPTDAAPQPDEPMLVPSARPAEETVSAEGESADQAATASTATEDEGEEKRIFRSRREAVLAARRLAWEHMAIGDLASARKTLAASLQMWPTSATDRHLYGTVLQAQGEEVAAAAQFRQAIDNVPAYAPPYLSLGLILDKKGKRGQAIELYRKAIGIDKGFAEAHYSLGVALAKEDEVIDALYHLRRAYALRPDLPGLRYNLYIAYERAGHLAQSERDRIRSEAEEQGDPAWTERLRRFEQSVVQPTSREPQPTEAPGDTAGGEVAEG